MDQLLGPSESGFPVTQLMHDQWINELVAR